MDKVTKIKIKLGQNSYSDPIPIGTNAENVVMSNGETLETVIGGVSATTDGSIKQQLDGLKDAVGGPIPVSTVAEMNEDTTRAYLYTGNETGYTYGNWYYYDGSNWTSGGQYLSNIVTIDDTLNVSGAAADAATVGAAIANVETVIDSALDGTSTNPVQNKVVTEELTDLKSAINTKVSYNEAEHYTETIVLPYDDFSAGTLKSDGTVESSDTFSVSDYIDIHNAEKVYRYGTTTRYRIEKYAVYDSSHTLLEYHAATTNYEFETYAGRSDVVSYDISNQGAYYIRIVINKSYTALNYAIYYVNDTADYTLYGNFYAANIVRDEQDIESNTDKISLLNIENLRNKNFIILKTGDTVQNNTYINPETGVVSTGDNYYNYVTTDYIPVESGVEYTFLNSHSVTMYDASQTRLGALTSSSLNVDYLFDYTFPQTIEYIRITFTKANLNGSYGVCRKITDPSVVCLGDSIFGLNPDIFDVPSRAQEKCGIQIANCAFGGTTASTHGDTDYAPFSFHNLADDIYDEDFTDIVAKGNLARYYTRHTDNLENVEWDGVKIVTIAYGTNDWNFNKTLDNSENKYDVTTFCGALRYGIEKILTKYPHIIIVLFSPIWRLVDEASVDTTPNGNSVYLREFVSAVKDIAEEYHLPYYDHFDIGLNTLTVNTFLRDGTHLTYTDGVDLLGTKVGAEINSIM